MTKQKLNIDILTANYNNGAYLEQFFESVINSTVWPHRLILVDDGSKDDSVSIMRKYADSYDFICLVILPQNVGFANALNAGIEYIESKYVLRVDPDDYIDCSRIENQYNYLENHPDVGAVGSNIVYFDSASGKKLFGSNVDLNPSKIIKTFRNGACGLIHGATTFRAELIRKYGYTQENVPAEDYELFCRMLIDGASLHNTSDCYTYVRVHINSVSNSLPFSTVNKTYRLATQMWNKKYSPLKIRLKHLHLKYYRRFLFENKKHKKIYYLIVSATLSPDKVIKRICKR